MTTGVNQIESSKESFIFVFRAILAACGGGSGGGGSFGGLGTTTTASKEAESTSATGGKEAAATVQKLDASWTKVADEGQTVSLATATVVQYGANDSFVQKTVTGSMSCTNAFFGHPLPGVAKACYTQSGTAAPRARLPQRGSRARTSPSLSPAAPS